MSSPAAITGHTPSWIERFHLAFWPGETRDKAAGTSGGNRLSGMMGSSEDPERFRRNRSEGVEYHKSVLLEEATYCLEPGPGKLFLDCTLGGGGHAEQLLRAGSKVIGLDQDPAALSFARARLSDYEENFGAIQGNFRDFGEILDTIGIKGVDGIILDLGVSSRQLDDPERGFSFAKDGPLDMRMNPSTERNAADLINTEAEEELARIFYQYGEERASRKVARAVVAAREKEKIETTLQLANIVSKVIPKRSRLHPATRVFQGLRIAVNDELRSIESALSEVSRWLRPGGRLVVISFHSLEDRIVKTFLKRSSREFIDRPEWPERDACR